MALFRSFVLGKDPYPDWFVALDKANRVTYETEGDGTLLRVRIRNPKGIVRVDVGETVVDTGDSIIKLSKRVLDQYSK